MELRVFLDETGVHDDAPVTAVAGYFAHPKQWKIFDRRWRSALEDFKLQRFHTREYAHRFGPFEGWNNAKHVAVASKLFPLIPEYTRWGVAVAMVKKEFDEGLKDYPEARAALGHPYGCCFHWFISLVFSSLRDQHKEARLAVIHEDNDYKKAALEIWEQLRKDDQHRQLVSLTFMPKCDFAGLQAADILAWEAQKRLAEPNRPERKSLAALRNRQNITIQYIKRDWLVANGERLNKLAQKGVVPVT